MLKGRTPPLTELELKPGSHTISVSNGNHAPLQTELHLAPGERVTITHRFGTPQRRVERRQEQNVGNKIEGAVQRMRRRMGW